MRFDNLTRQQLAHIRHESEKDLLFHTRFWFRMMYNSRFIVNWHHGVMRDELHRVEKYELEFLNINIPPRFSKTQVAGVDFISRGIGINPSSNWLYITASDELRQITSTSIRDIIRHPYFKTMYGVDLKADQNSKNLWRTTQGGGLKTATISGQITGFGAGQIIDIDPDLADYIRDFEGCIVLDDINKIDDTESESANNDKVNRIIFNTIFSRKNSEDTPIINIQQRAGENDATARLEEHFRGNPKAKFLVIPARQPDGKPTWPKKLSEGKLKELEESPETAHVFLTQYQQEPTSPHGKPFHRSKLSWFYRAELESILKNSEACISYIDPKDDGNDFYCHPFGHIIGDTVYITGVIHNQANTSVTVPKSIILIEENNASYTVIETNNMGGMIYKDLKEAVTQSIIPLSNQANKETRIAMAEAGIIKHFRFLKDPDPKSEYPSYIKKLTGYEYGKETRVDDAPDATAGLYQLFFMKFRHLVKIKRAEDSESKEE